VLTAEYSAIAAARQRSDYLDTLVAGLARSLTESVAVIALGAYARRELTPHADAEILFLHDDELSQQTVTEAISYPLWEQSIHVEALVRTIDQCDRDARRSWVAASRFLDMRDVTGHAELFTQLKSKLQHWRRDREHLRHRIRSDVQHRHATHPSVTSSTTPDLVAGRGGLLDVNVLRWLSDEPTADRTLQALEAMLAVLETAEQLVGHAVHRLSARVLNHLESEGKSLPEIYRHARWVAFNLDSALTPVRDDRRVGPSLALRDGKLVADRPPSLHRAPSLGLRVANLVGLAPPANELLEWAAAGSQPVRWDETTQQQFWLFLRAADWRAWDFLDVSGLLLRYLPEFQELWRIPGSARSGDVALDIHSFQALRMLHAWSESDDVLARRIWRWLRHRDWVYLAVLLHELSAESAAAAVARLGLPDTAVEAIKTAVFVYQRVLDTATRRDVNDEDLLLELATHIGARPRLSMVFLVAVAHELANGRAAWSDWKADLMLQLFGHLEVALRQPGEVGARRMRSLEQHRERIVLELARRNLYAFAPVVARLPRRYVLTHTPAFVARHLALLAREPLRDREVRTHAYRRRQPGLWDMLLVARDRPGLLATVAGVLALRGASVLAADAATSADGLVLDVFTVRGADEIHWPRIQNDLHSALHGNIPLHDLLGSREMPPEDAAAIHVAIDNVASQFFNLVEVRAPDQVGLLYRIASALHAEGLDIHHARIATHPEGALDVFYVRNLSGEKLSDSASEEVASRVSARLRGEV
jgi:[protein-PII] uridylyltransferase